VEQRCALDWVRPITNLFVLGLDPACKSLLKRRIRTGFPLLMEKNWGTFGLGLHILKILGQCLDFDWVLTIQNKICIVKNDSPLISAVELSGWPQQLAFWVLYKLSRKLEYDQHVCCCLSIGSIRITLPCPVGFSRLHA